MSEELYTSIEGPNGTVDIYEVYPDQAERDQWQREGFGTARPGDMHFEVRFNGEVQSFLVEGEAASVAAELAGVRYT